jgi:hypothetical protein
MRRWSAVGASVAVLVGAACATADPGLDLGSDDALRFRTEGARWDSITYSKVEGPVSEIPVVVRLTGERHRDLQGRDGEPVYGDFLVPYAETSRAYFEYASHRHEVSWQRIGGDSVRVGTNLGFGGFELVGRVDDRQLIGTFRWHVDSGFHNFTTARAAAPRIACPAIPDSTPSSHTRLESNVGS